MGILLRNWHLKLGALALATILYTGLVFSGSFSESTAQVRITTTGQPRNAIVLSSDLGSVDIRYRVTAEAAGSVDTEAFVATVDLAQYDMERPAEPQVLDVDVSSLVDGVEILTLDPPTVTVVLDELAVRTVPVFVDVGEAPEGLEVGRPRLSVSEVQVRGAASLVDLVDRAVANVRIDPSGIDVESAFALRAVDAEGQPIGGGVELSPDSVSVELDVRTTETNKTVPVRPQITGTPAPGFALAGLRVEPSTVTLRGLPDVLAAIDEVLTDGLSIDGAATDQTFGATLSLPEGTRIAGGGSPSAEVVATIVPSEISRTFVVGILCTNQGENACLPNLDQVAVTLSGPADVVADLGAGDLAAVVNVGGLPPGDHTVNAALGPLPEGVVVVSVSPSSVPVTIRAPATPPPTPAPTP